MSFSKYISTYTTTSVEICAVWVTQRHAIAFLKSVRQKLNFSETFQWQEIPRRKTNKSYDKTAVQNDRRNNTKKILNLILENVMLKTIIEVYFLTNFYAQISCSRHLKFVKIISNLMHRIGITVFVYISFAALHVSYMSHKIRAKIMAQLSFVQRLQIANQKGCFNFDNRRARDDFLSKQYLTSLYMRRANVP